jgi:maltooligosyltrehalose trehalohydrolase
MSAPPSIASRADAPSARDGLGALPAPGGGVAFRVWAPSAGRVRLHLLDPVERFVEMDRDDHGCFAAAVDNVQDGHRYWFRLDDGPDRPDPASRHQPDGVHGPSAVLEPAFEWQHPQWRGTELERYVIYELHVGTFTPDGTFDAAIGRLDGLRELGITAVELMPVAEFPGRRNWGYDGVFPFAAQSSYGGPLALKRFVDACHARGMAVLLDVVYNHLGPEGSVLADFGPYFTDRYRTPWGDALNFDGRDSDQVREYFIRNALQWVDEFRIDGLRLDAVHAILDTSAQPFLRLLADRVRHTARRLGREIILIAESDLGDPRMIRDAARGGMGMHAQWLDDFHHAVHALLTGETDGYYGDYGAIEHIARCYAEGFVYSGHYSRYRGRRHGAAAPDAHPRQFVVFVQNHDQVGNRMTGDRLSATLAPAQLRLAAAATILSPFTPLLFMGEEYGERAPFPYFVSHSDPALVEAVRKGRREEFAGFSWKGEPPDPQDEATFRSAVLDWSLRDQPAHRSLLEFHRACIQLRPLLPAPVSMDDDDFCVAVPDGRDAVVLRWTDPRRQCILILNFRAEAADLRLAARPGSWRVRLDSDSAQWGGAGGRAGDLLECDGHLDCRVAAFSAVLLIRES